MTTQIIFVLILTMFINLITTLSYAVRIVGVRTGIGGTLLAQLLFLPCAQLIALLAEKV